MLTVKAFWYYYNSGKLTLIRDILYHFFCKVNKSGSVHKGVFCFLQFIHSFYIPVSTCWCCHNSPSSTLICQVKLRPVLSTQPFLKKHFTQTWIILHYNFKYVKYSFVHFWNVDINFFPFSPCGNFNVQASRMYNESIINMVNKTMISCYFPSRLKMCCFSLPVHPACELLNLNIQNRSEIVNNQ